MSEKCTSCDPVGGLCESGDCHCREGYMAYTCGMWTRDIVNQPFFLLYRWATFGAFAFLGIWALQAVRLRREESKSRCCSSAATLCLVLMVFAAACRCVEFGLDPHMWAGVLPWNLRAITNVALMFMMASYCTEIIVWINLVQKFAVHTPGISFRCMRHQPSFLAGSVGVMSLSSTVSLVLDSTGIVSDRVGTLWYNISLMVVMLLSFGYTLVFGGRVVQVLGIVKVSQESKVLQRLTRFIFLACSQNLCVAVVLTINNFHSCENIIVPFAQCFVAWYGAFRIMEVAGCVLVILAVRRAYSEEQVLFTDTGWTTEQLSSQVGAAESSAKPSSFPSFPVVASGPSMMASPLITPFVSPRHTASFFSLDELLLRAGEENLGDNDFMEGGQSIGTGLTERMLSPVNDTS